MRRITDASREAGIGRYARPTFEQVERRRLELMGLTFFALLGVSGALLLISFGPSSLREEFGGLTNVLLVALVALGVAVTAWIFDKHRRLRTVTNLLVNERVMSAALRNRLRETSFLSSAGKAVAAGLGLQDTLGIVLRAACELLEADEGSVLIEEDGDFVLSAGVGRLELFIGQRQPATDGVAGYVARSRQPVLIDGDLEMIELGVLVDRPVGRDLPVRSAICIPLEVHGRLLGVMSVNVTEGARSFEEYDRQTLELFGHHAAIAIHQSRVLHLEPGTALTDAAELERIRNDLVDGIAGGQEADPTGFSAEAVASGGPRRRREPMRLLLVDDDPAILRFLQVGLEADNFEVVLASDGETALERIRHDAPHVVLLDLSIPVMDGWRVLERLKDQETRPRVICLTAKHGRRDRVRAWELGVDDYVTKPFGVAELLDLIRDVAHRSPGDQAERRQQALQELYSVG